ncbi:MAG: transcriptional regulator, partial [Flavobacteriaceae bacterium]|nr:transcriptional regulator [Flavobacteriaceae bacterium]
PKIDTIIKVANYFSIEIGAILTRELTVNELLKFKTDITALTNDIANEKFTEVPCITEMNASDYLVNHDKENFVDQMPKLTLPIKNTSAARGYTINNLEMTSHDKGLFPKDIAVGHEYPVNKVKDLINGTLVLVLTSNKLILRRVYTTKEQIVLRADHINIDDIELNTKDIVEIWKIKYVFYKRIPDVNDELEQRLLLLSNELNAIKKKIE